jgi:hypothetical protein
MSKHIRKNTERRASMIVRRTSEGIITALILLKLVVGRANNEPGDSYEKFLRDYYHYAITFIFKYSRNNK